jgi:hypothetical protein
MTERPFRTARGSDLPERRAGTGVKAARIRIDQAPRSDIPEVHSTDGRVPGSFATQNSMIVMSLE